MSRIYVIHENDAWVEPLRAAFAELRLPHEEWFLSEGTLDFSATPPDGVFYNRALPPTRAGIVTRRSSHRACCRGSNRTAAAW